MLFGESLEIAIFQIRRSGQNHQQGCRALDLPVDFDVELIQRASKPFLDMTSLGPNRS